MVMQRASHVAINDGGIATCKFVNGCRCITMKSLLDDYSRVIDASL
jgi:hypothetical protein